MKNKKFRINEFQKKKQKNIYKSYQCIIFEKSIKKSLQTESLVKLLAINQNRIKKKFNNNYNDENDLMTRKKIEEILVRIKCKCSIMIDLNRSKRNNSYI